MTMKRINQSRKKCSISLQKRYPGDVYKRQLLGGDVIDFPSQGNLSFLEKNLEMLEMPYLYVPGNHDWRALVISQ